MNIKNLKKGGRIQFAIATVILAIALFAMLVTGELPGLEYMVLLGILVIFIGLLGLAGEMDYQLKKYKR